MKTIKKSVSLLLSIIVMFSMLCEFSVMQVAAQGLSLAQLQAKFPNGAYWNHYVNVYTEAGDYLFNVSHSEQFADKITYTPCAQHGGTGGYDHFVGKYDCNYFDGGAQCCGFARKLAYDVYGTRASGWGQHSSINSIKPGDVVHFYGAGADPTYGHWVFVTAVSGTTITVGECNVGGYCKIRWGASYNLSSAWSITVFSAPYAFNGGTAAKPSLDLATDYYKYGVSDTNACICARVNNPAGGTIAAIGCYLYGESGDLLLRHQEQCDPRYVHYTQVHIWTDFWVDAEFSLQPGTTYRYVMYAYVDNVEYQSEWGSFQTSGEKTFKATTTVSKKTICVGERVTLRVNASHANGYHLGIWKDGARVVDNKNSNATVTYTPTEPGNYYAYFTARNSAGQIADSNKVYWTVIENRLGDMNGDSAVTAADALLALQAATGKIVLIEAKKSISDVNGDGIVTAADALLILQYATKKITVF